MIASRKEEGRTAVTCRQKEAKNADDDVIDFCKHHYSESPILPRNYLNNISIYNDERLYTLLYSQRRFSTLPNRRKRKMAFRLPGSMLEIRVRRRRRCTRSE